LGYSYFDLVDEFDPLTPNEQKMFYRLQEVVPELIVLAQVSFSALLTAKSQGAHNRFS
jgi:hypothetical protein